MSKKIFLLSILLALLTTSLFSDAKANRSFTDISMLLKEDKKLSEDTVYDIQSLSVDLNGSQKMIIMNEYEKTSGMAFALNFFLPFGIGSFVQGDTTGGAIVAVGEVAVNAGFLVAYYAIIMEYLSKQQEYDDYNDPYYEDSYYNDTYYEDSYEDDLYNDVVTLRNQMIAAVAIYSAAYAGIKIFSWVRPFTFASGYNRRLEEALNPGFSMAPVVAPTFTSNGETGLFAGVTVRL